MRIGDREICEIAKTTLAFPHANTLIGKPLMDIILKVELDNKCIEDTFTVTPIDDTICIFKGTETEFCVTNGTHLDIYFMIDYSINKEYNCIDMDIYYL